jgi:hypothetical protein
MKNELDPIVGNWYVRLDLDKDKPFQVVAIDDAARAIELQHFDGDIEECDFDEWRVMDLELAEEPEDWTGPIDDVEKDDLGYTEP